MSPVDDRPTWDEIWMNLAVDLARRSRCVRDQVGCVVVTSNNRVNSASYNGPPPGADPGPGRCDNWCPRALTTMPSQRLPDYSDCPSTHAEANAMVRADFSEIKGGAIYVSSTPCVVCAKNLGSSGVGRVIFRVNPANPRDPVTASFFIESGGPVAVEL